MRRDDPQNRGTGEHHREREQRGEQALAERPGPPGAHSRRGSAWASEPEPPRFTLGLVVASSDMRVTLQACGHNPVSDKARVNPVGVCTRSCHRSDSPRKVRSDLRAKRARQWTTHVRFPQSSGVAGPSDHLDGISVWVPDPRRPQDARKVVRRAQ